MTPPPAAGGRIRVVPWALLLLATATVVTVLTTVDLSPRVETDFFFSREDPQLQAGLEISRRFPASPQVIVRVAASDISSQAYRSGVDALTEELAGVGGIDEATSVANESAQSPLWSRLLLNPDGLSTNVILQTDGTPADVLLPRLEEVTRPFDGPDFRVQMSGVPVIVELIRRSLFRDLVLFSSVALVLFGLLIGVVYRRVTIVAGTLASCLMACSLTLIGNQVLGIAIGLLTANIITIVFVLTLSHVVFLSANWRLSSGHGHERVREAVRTTLPASLWCMVTTLLGFLSLLLATARPLRDLGMAGALGTVVALAVAYAVYPPFLAVTAPASGAERRDSGDTWSRRLPTGPRGRWLAGLAAWVLLVGLGLPLLSTDPGLLTYFGEGTVLREGLEAIDRDGGSSTLEVVVRDAEGARLDSPEANDKLWAFQDALEADSTVGVVLSSAVLLAHARRQPLAGFLSLGQLADILESPLADGVGLGFLEQDRLAGRVLMRIRESGRTGTRQELIQRVEALAHEAGLEPVLIGGVFDLQARLADLIGRSLRTGLGGLLLVFVAVGWLVSRRWSVTAAMFLCLCAIPLVVLGAFGHLRVAVDMITSPAANVALAMGVDSMIHLVTQARRPELGTLTTRERWLAARDRMARPVLAATLIICVGFGVFALSTFPPTGRFGLAVMLGTATAAVLTLVALPLAVGGAAPAPAEPSG